MVEKVYLAVCDNCNTVSNEPGSCIECMGDMQVIAFVRTGQLTPVAADGVHTWTCPHCGTLNYGTWPFCHKCRR